MALLSANDVAPSAGSPAGEVGTWFDLVIKPITGSTLLLHVSSDATVENVRVMIHAEKGIPSEQQRLIYAGKQLEDGHTLDEYGINKHHCTVYLVRTGKEVEWLDIFIKTITGKNIPLHIASDSRVEDVKAMIQNKQGIQPDRQRLVSAGKLMEDGHTLAEYGVNKHNRIIYLKPDVVVRSRAVGSASSPDTGKEVEGLDIFIHTLNGETIPLHLASDATVVDVKAMIENKQGNPPRSQRIIFAGRQLEDGWTLAEYGIGDQSTLHLLHRLSGSIGLFTALPHDPHTETLHQPDADLAARSSSLAVQHPRAMAAVAPRQPATYKIQTPDQHKLLTAAQCAALVPLVDACHAHHASTGSDTRDFKVKIGCAALAQQALGAAWQRAGMPAGSATTINRLLDVCFPDRPEEFMLVLRRTAGPTVGAIPWHVDQTWSGKGRKVIGVALNDDMEYVGGRLCYYSQENGIQRVTPRPAGTLTEHTVDVVHAVTPLVQGRRYGLFLLSKHFDTSEQGVAGLTASLILRTADDVDAVLRHLA